MSHLLALARALGREAVLQQPLPQLVVHLRQMGLAFEAHRLVYHSTSGSRVMEKKMVRLFTTHIFS